MIDIDKLEKLAKAATPGAWDAVLHAHGTGVENDDEQLFIEQYGLTYAANPSDALFIAAANPQAVLELIERVRRAENARDGWASNAMEYANAITGAEVLLSRIAEAVRLHRKYTYYGLEDSCPDTTDEHREEHHHETSDDIGEFYCDQMPTGDVVCIHCRDVDGDRVEWPCETAKALGLSEGSET